MPAAERRTLDFRPVLRNRAAMAFIVGYAGHTWELFALRAWLVAFLVGAVLDLAGGDASRLAWLLAMLTMGAGSAAAFVAIRRL